MQLNCVIIPITNWYFDSLLPIKGRFIWCQGCGHGGHANHINEWFGEKGLEVCPAGCGHRCQAQDCSTDDEDLGLNQDLHPSTKI